MVQIKVLVTGQADLRWGGENWREEPGGCMAIAPECAFKVVRRLSEKATTLRACVAPQLFDEWMRRRGGPRSTDFHVRHLPDPALGDALWDLEQRLREVAGPTALRASFDRLMRQTRHFLAITRETRVGRRPEIRKAVQILQEHFADSVPLDLLTESVGLSKFHLIRLFRDEVGVAPHAYQLQLRISHARELLASGISVADVAAACGFADQAHFSRCFKSNVGYTPGAFRRLG